MWESVVVCIHVCTCACVCVCVRETHHKLQPLIAVKYKISATSYTSSKQGLAQTSAVNILGARSF